MGCLKICGQRIEEKHNHQNKLYVNEKQLGKIFRKRFLSIDGILKPFPLIFGRKSSQRITTCVFRTYR